MTPETFEADVLQRLTRLETLVGNHIPSQIADLKAAMKSLDARMWALLVVGFGALLGAWLR